MDYSIIEKYKDYKPLESVLTPAEYAELMHEPAKPSNVVNLADYRANRGSYGR